MQQRAASFGRKGQASGETERRPITLDKAEDAGEIDRRREAFIAAERARREREGGLPAPVDRDEPTSRSFVQPKSVGTAYILWFLLGAFAAHRFYVGSASTAFAQIALRLVGVLILVSADFFLGLYLLAAALLWLVVDAFLLPDLVRKANARRAAIASGRVFA